MQARNADNGSKTVVPESIGSNLPRQSEKRAAYSELVKTYQSALLRSARRMCCGNDDRAQDLVQEALIRGYEAFLAGSFREGSNARAWLLRILANGFINDYNRRKKWEAGCSLESLTEAANARLKAIGVRESERPEDALLNQTLDEPLSLALEALPVEFRMCVLLVDVEGLEYRDAATALNVPIGTVRSRLSRARLQLHRSLYEYARDRRNI